MTHEEKSQLGWAIANWLHSHEDFRKELADNIFFGAKIGEHLIEYDIQRMLEKYSDAPFTAADLLTYLNRKDREGKLLIEFM